MPKILFFQAVLLCLLISSFLLVSLSFAGQRQVHVKWVPDGDTLYLQSGEIVRLKGIDSPEVGHDNQPGQYYALQSRQELWSLVKGKSLYIDRAGLKKDRFKRLLACVRFSNGQILNKILLENGSAFCYFSSDQSPQLQKDFLEAQHKAMQAKTGFWSKLLRIPAAKKKYQGNKRSQRFHSLSCPFGQRINKKNKTMFSNLKEAFWAGFAPCRRCTPWPLYNLNQ